MPDEFGDLKPTDRERQLMNNLKSSPYVKPDPSQRVHNQTVENAGHPVGWLESRKQKRQARREQTILNGGNRTQPGQVLTKSPNEFAELRAVENKVKDFNE
jgi:hypothetical protein